MLLRPGQEVAPGGGRIRHLFLMEKEGSAVAEWLNGAWGGGVCAEIPARKPAYHHPVELGDAQRAIRDGEWRMLRSMGSL